MNVHPGHIGFAVALDHAQEFPAVVFVKAGVVGHQIDRGNALGSQIFHGHSQQLSSDALTAMYLFRVDGADIEGQIFAVMEWDVDDALKPELDTVKACMPDRILFLNASVEILRRKRQNDPTRSRNFFDHYLQHFLPLKKAWFLGRSDVDVLDVDDLTPEELGQKVKEWVYRWCAIPTER